MKLKTRYIIAIILIIVVITIAGSIFLRYHIKPSNVYIINSNIVISENFENFNQTVSDCCNGLPDNPIIFESKSKDSIDGNYSLNLTSQNHCACVNKPILNFSNLDMYLITFYYRGDNPRFCNYVSGDNQCLPNIKLDSNKTWNQYKTILYFTNKSTSASVFLYADSTGTRTVTNLYDDLQVHKLTPIPTSSPFDANQSYIIKTNPGNLVKGEQLNNQGYYLITGKPEITLRFPWTEIIILIIIMVIVIRLLFKKQINELEEDFSQGIRRDIEKTIKLHGRTNN